MLLKEPELVESIESQDFSSNGKTIRIEIYRLEDESEWALAFDDEYGNTTVHDHTFKTAKDALEEGKKTVLEDGIEAFIGPEHGLGWPT